MTAMATRSIPCHSDDRETRGMAAARRRLAVSVAALALSFAVWMAWSVVVVLLPHVGFRFSANQLFWLVALPGLAAGTLRLLFTFMIPVFGGRHWSALSTAALLLPAVGLTFAVQDPTTGYPTFLALALAVGVGGGSFAPSLAIRASFEEQAVIFTRKHNWILSWLTLGTFGSYLGFAAGFPLLSATEFSDIDAATYAFAGPLAGALAWPLGSWLAHRYSGARIALAAFVAMALATAGLLIEALAAPSYPVFAALFGVLFVASGAGHGAVYRMIPAVFVGDRCHALAGIAEAEPRARREGALESAAALGFASGIAAFGGFFIPKAFGTAVAITGGTAAALYPFVAFYASCVVVTWWFYARRRPEPAC